MVDTSKEMGDDEDVILGEWKREKMQEENETSKYLHFSRLGRHEHVQAACHLLPCRKPWECTSKPKLRAADYYSGVYGKDRYEANDVPPHNHLREPELRTLFWGVQANGCRSRPASRRREEERSREIFSLSSTNVSPFPPEGSRYQAEEHLPPADYRT